MPNILIIDDRQDNLISMSALLKALLPDSAVDTALSGREGIEKAFKEPPDTILLDIRMPEMDGYEVCRRLKADRRTRHIPIIMLSAVKTGSTDLVKGLDHGADAYLAKPIDEYVLAAQVKTALRIKSAEDRLRRQKEQLEEKVREKSRQLLQAQKMEAIGTLAGGIAHDFNNILSSIIGYTELSMDDAAGNPGLMDNLQEVYAAGNRARDLVRQILAISRQDEQKVKPVQVVPLVKEALKLLRSTIPTSIEFREEITGGNLVVMADPTLVHRIVVNLTTNASQAMTGGTGVLTARICRQEIGPESPEHVPGIPTGEYAHLAIGDTGTGIPPEHLDKIFEPYFTTKEKGIGTGLGLSVVHGIVKNAGGHITVESRPGEGTEFHVFLPLVKKRAAHTLEPSAVPLTGGTEHILLVDDEPSIVKMQQLKLEQLGYRVTADTGSSEALKLFESAPDRFDIVITDMTMPGMTGDVLAQKIKAIRPDTPVILCTGYSERITPDEENPDIDRLLMKPVDKVTLTTTLRELLDGKNG